MGKDLTPKYEFIPSNGFMGGIIPDEYKIIDSTNSQLENMRKALDNKTPVAYTIEPCCAFCWVDNIKTEFPAKEYRPEPKLAVCYYCGEESIIDLYVNVPVKK